MNPNFVTYKIYIKLNKTTLVHISGKRVPCNISTIKVCLKQCFRHQNLQIHFTIFFLSSVSMTISK